MRNMELKAPNNDNIVEVEILEDNGDGTLRIREVDRDIGEHKYNARKEFVKNNFEPA
jgi:hypothetical protein